MFDKSAPQNIYIITGVLTLVKKSIFPYYVLEIIIKLYINWKFNISKFILWF